MDSKNHTRTTPFLCASPRGALWSWPILHSTGNVDSIIDVDIHDGDLVLIRQQNRAYEGQIVVALTDDKATLKRYYPEPEKHRIRLHPENSQTDDINVSSCIIQGLAVKVLKDLK